MRVFKRRPRAALGVLVSATATAFFVFPVSPAAAGSATTSNACANSVTANFSQIEVTTSGADGVDTASPGDPLTLSGLSQSAAIPGDIFVAGYNLGLLVQGTNNVPANVRSTIEATNTVQGSQNTNTVGGSPPNGSVSVTTVITDPDGTAGTGDETATDASFSVNYADQTWTAGASGTVDYRQQSIAALPLSTANNTLLINALVGGVFNVQFRCAPGTVTGPDPGVISLIDPAGTFDSTNIQQPATPEVSIDDQTVAEGGTASFTVSLNNPSAQQVTVDFATSDGTANAPGDYTSNSGTVTFAPGDVSETVTVNTSQDALDENDETFNVNLSNAQGGGSTIADNQGVGTITDDDPAPAISIDDQTVAEGGTASFTVSLDAASGQQVTVDFGTSDGTANSPADYLSNSGTLTFAPGDTSETVAVNTNQDPFDENDETFNVDLSNASNATIADNQGVGTITDDDAEPALSINNAEANEGNAVTFTVTLDAASGKQVSVDFATADDTATAPGDYTSNTGTLTFAPGDTSEQVTVQTAEDTADEPDETFFVNLSNASNATIADNQGVGTILDDDVAAVTDAAMNVIVSGPTRSAAGAKTIKATITNVGTSTFQLSDTDVNWDILVDGSPSVNEPVALNPGTKTLSPGGKTTFRFSWEFGLGEVTPGATVDYAACVAVAGDSTAGNDCDTETRTAK